MLSPVDHLCHYSPSLERYNVHGCIDYRTSRKTICIIRNVAGETFHDGNMRIAHTATNLMMMLLKELPLIKNILSCRVVGCHEQLLQILSDLAQQVTSNEFLKPHLAQFL